MTSYTAVPDGEGQGRGSAITTREIAYILFRRRYVILAIALPIILVASLGLFKNTNSYIASCKIMLDLQAPEVPRWNTKAYVDYDRSLSTYQHMATSLPVARLAAESLRDSLDVITALDEGRYADLEKPGKLVEFLMDNLSAEPVGESTILELRFSAPSTRLSLMCLRAIQNVFLKYSMTATRKRSALSYYDEQVQQVSNDIDSLLALRSDLVRRAGFSYVEQDLKNLTALQAERLDDLSKAKVARRELEALARELRAAQERDPLFVPVPDKDHTSAAMMNAKERVDLLRSKLIELRGKYTDDNLAVRRVRERLAQEEEGLRREVEAFIRNIEVEAATARAKEQAIRDELAGLQLKLDKAPEIDRRVSLIDNEVASKQRLLRELQVKRGEVQINAEADERVNIAIKLTEPEIERVISGSRKIVYFLLISMMALVFALVVAFILDYQDHRLYSPDKLGETLGTPILGTITDHNGGS